MITGISGFGFFCPKMAVSWLRTVFQKVVLWNPYFIVFFGCALFWPSCQKREILDTHQKEKKELTDNWKALFWYFVFFFFFFSFFFFFFPVFFFSFLCFFGGFKGQVRWPEGPPHLALNPPYFFFVSFFVFVFCFFFFFGGFKGQVRWPKGPPHLALNPPYLFFFVPFLSLF